MAGATTRRAGEGNNAAGVAWNDDVEPEGFKKQQRQMKRSPTHEWPSIGLGIAANKNEGDHSLRDMRGFQGTMAHRLSGDVNCTIKCWTTPHRLL
jgi:hypothetical protein